MNKAIPLAIGVAFLSGTVCIGQDRVEILANPTIPPLQTRNPRTPASARRLRERLSSSTDPDSDKRRCCGVYLPSTGIS
jgi:hypothetical protein